MRRCVRAYARLDPILKEIASRMPSPVLPEERRLNRAVGLNVLDEKAFRGGP